jgi:hypothetical protein
MIIIIVTRTLCSLPDMCRCDVILMVNGVTTSSSKRKSNMAPNKNPSLSLSLSLSLSVGQQPNLGLGFLIVEVSRSNTNTHTSLDFWTSRQLVSEVNTHQVQETNVHTLSRIWPAFPAIKQSDLHFGLHSHWDQWILIYFPVLFNLLVVTGGLLQLGMGYVVEHSATGCSRF